MVASDTREANTYYTIEDLHASREAQRQREERKKSKPTLAEKANQGDLGALVDLLAPTHIGGRFQVEVSLDIGVAISGTVGANIVYNRHSNSVGANIDWAIEPGVGVGAGASCTGGPLLGSGSSNPADVTNGYSGVVSGTLADGGAISGALTVPLDASGLHVDPNTGVVPTTFYLGGGAGMAYLGGGAGINGPWGISVEIPLP